MASKLKFVMVASIIGLAAVLVGPAGTAQAAELDDVIQSVDTSGDTGVNGAFRIDLGFEVPGDISRVGWLGRSAAANDLIGTPVIAGHVSDWSDRPGAMRNLSKATKGQLVRYTTAAGETIRFKIISISISISTAPRDGTLPKSLFRTTGAHLLVLVNCTGKVTCPNDSSHYSKNQIVIATRVR